MNWRWIPSSFIPPQGHMEFDRQLFHSFDPGGCPVLRFFTFEKPTYTLGRLEARRLVLDHLPYPYEIRPTGGWSVLHGKGDLCYSIVASTRDNLVGGDLITSYRKISEILVQGMKRLGRDVELSEEKHRSYGLAHCFTAPSKCELILGGRKVAGGAQAREGGVFLQQGVILLSVSPEWKKSFPASDLETMTGLNEQEAPEIRREALERAILETFESSGIKFDKNLNAESIALKM